jgi:hypothetical protein
MSTYLCVKSPLYEDNVRKDRAAIEKLIAEDFHFTGPLDNRIDRATYFNPIITLKYELILCTHNARAFRINPIWPKRHK